VSDRADNSTPTPREIFTWPALFGTTALLVLFDALHLAARMYAEGLHLFRSGVNSEYFSALGLMVVHDLGFSALALSVLALAVAVRTRIVEWDVPPKMATWAVSTVIAIPFGISLSAGEGLARLVPRWISLPTLTLVLGSGLFVAAWIGGRLVHWLSGRDTTASHTVRVALVTLGGLLLAADAYMFSGLYPSLHLLWASIGAAAALLAMSTATTGRPVGSIALTFLVASGIAASTLGAYFLPSAHARAALNTIGARHNSMLANRLADAIPNPRDERRDLEETAGEGLAVDASASPHILILSIDGVNIRYVGHLGASNGITPFLDDLANKSLVFERAYAPASNTRGTIGDLFTDATMTRRTNSSPRGSDGICPMETPPETLPSIFSNTGYATLCDFAYARTYLSCAAVGCNVRLDSRSRQQSFELVLQQATRDEPFFAFIHLMETHVPYRGFDAAVSEQMPDATDYEKALFATDRAIGQFYHKLQQVTDRPILLIVLSDHGEALGEHGHQTHHTSIYDEQVRVPLIIHGPGVETGRVPEPVNLTWLYQSLIPLAGQRVTGTTVPSTPSTPVEQPVFLRNRSWYGVVRGDWKYIEVRDKGARKLFHLADDPDETRNLVGEHPGIAAELDRLLERRYPD
jgi:hypothetical protein